MINKIRFELLQTNKQGGVHINSERFVILGIKEEKKERVKKNIKNGCHEITQDILKTVKETKKLFYKFVKY